ncbi:MAG: hypothetical protein VCA36_09030 [Opitutales bacterium]
MSSQELFATLAYLAGNRLLGIEADAKLDPFRGQDFDLGLVFDSASRTIGTRFDNAYEQGYTVICKMEEDEDLEIAVLMLPDDNDKVDALTKGDTFEAKLKVLDYDSLFQRSVFGQTIEEGDDPEPQEEPESYGTTPEAYLPQEPAQQPELEPEPEPEPEPTPEPVPEPEPAPPPEQHSLEFGLPGAALMGDRISAHRHQWQTTN